MTCFDGIARWRSMLSVQSLRRCPWWIFFYHMGLLMQQDICSVMYVEAPASLLFRLESSGYTIFCSHTQLKRSWYLHCFMAYALYRFSSTGTVLLWLLFLSFLSRLWYQDVWPFLLFEGTLFVCVLHPSELPSHWLFVGCRCILSLAVVSLGFCRLYHLQYGMQLWG